MFKVIPGFLAGLLPGLALAAGPQSHAQLYDLEGKHEDQVVMLSNWPEERRFATYEESPDGARKHFPKSAAVWIWCDGKSSVNRIESIDASGDRGWTTIDLAEKPVCNSRPLLMSNYPFPEQRWSAARTSEKDLQAIRKKLAAEKELKVTTIVSEEKGSFHLVFDPTIQSAHEMGGYRLLDGNLNPISVFRGAPLSPLIDLTNDTVPEFFFPSSDGLDAWIYQLFPEPDMQESHHDEPMRQEPKRSGNGKK